MKNIKIYCVTNKIKKNLENTKLTLAGVGQENFPSNYITSNTKDNIFFKEKYYSELTFHYWFWKNILNKSENNWIGFCQKRRFWIKKDTDNQTNLNNRLLEEVPEEWKNYESILCESIDVNKVKKMKIIKRGFKNLIKEPSILFDKNKRSLKLHFDMHHGYGNLDKAIDVMNESDKEDFRHFVINSCSYNPHIMFISKPHIIDKWFSDLFEWLFRCEDIFGFDKLEGYDNQRLYAYLAERYLSFWFKKYTKTLEWPWIMYED
jgi:hypothetical protein